MIITDKDIKHCVSRDRLNTNVVCYKCAFVWLNTDMKSLENACFATWDFVENGTPFAANHTHIKDVV